MSEHLRTVWAMSATVTSTYKLAMQDLSARSYTTSEQDNKFFASRVRRDETDVSKVAVCDDLLFLHVFTGCDSVSRVFGIGKKYGFQQIIKREKTMRGC